MTTCMLEAKGLANLWAEAMHVSTHIQNRFPHSSMKGKTPFKAYFGHKPDVSNFKVLGPLHGLKFCMTRGKICNHKVLNVCSLDIQKNIRD